MAVVPLKAGNPPGSACISPSCGRPFGGPVRFCPFCGARQEVRPTIAIVGGARPAEPAETIKPVPLRQDAGAAPSTPAPAPPLAPAIPQPPATPGRGKRRFPTGRVAVVAVGALIAGWLVLPLGKTDPGSVTVTLTAGVAGNVTIDGSPAGVPGERISVPAGTHMIGFQADGWTAEGQTLVVQSGQSFRLSMTPHPLPVALEVTTSPRPALLTVDDRPVGTTPASLSLPPGRYRLRVTGEGYMPSAQTVLLRPDQPQTIVLTLHPLVTGPSPSPGFVPPAPSPVLTPVPIPAPVPGLVPPAAADRQDAAMTFARRYFATWSRSNDTAMDFARSAYAPEVNYYGAMTSEAAVLAAKQAFVTRWPQRRYTIRPETLRVDCDADQCHVSGTVDYIAISDARAAHAAGTATFELDIAERDGRITIVGESGHVLNRAD